MGLVQDSKDLLYLVIAFCALWLTIFLAWFIYYLAMIMRQVLKIIQETREKIAKINTVIKEFKEKMEHSASYLAVISEGVKKIGDIVKEHTGKEKKKGKSKK